MIDHLSPREEEELAAALTRGEAWPRALACFADGPRLLLGWDRALGEAEIARRLGADTAAVHEVLERAGRWCAAHGLHLMSYAGEGPGADPVGETRWFMAVG